MPLRVLLADDSVPAQNMGKKILVDAGYDVLTVSNGLEALRKIADNPPDIAILDIFMPGYNGLEICERLRASAATATLPVILTVGKLEPYRPEDGEHVHSNAVIVKPFAAAELVSAVRSLIGTVPEAAPSHPQVGGETLSPNSSIAAAILPPPSPALSAIPVRPAEASEDVADEPLFSYRPSGVSGDSAPLTAQETSVYGHYGDAPLLSNTDSDRPESLMFDPEGASQPFSASALDDLLLPSIPQFPAAYGSQASTDFDRQSSPSISASGRRGFSVEQPPLTATAAMTVPEPEVVIAETAIALEDTVSASASPAESMSASLDIPPHDPLLEVNEADLPSPSADTAGALEAFTPESPAAQEEAVPSSPLEHLSPEEEARRAAFEALFNSPDPLALIDAQNDTDSLPAIAEPNDDSFDVLETESLNEDSSQPGFTAPNSHPLSNAKLDEAEPMSAVGAIPECAPLPADAPQQASSPETGFAPEPADAFAAGSSEMNSPPPAEVAKPESSLLAPDEVEQILAGVHFEATEASAPPAEVAKPVDTEQSSEPAPASEYVQIIEIEELPESAYADTAPEQLEVQQIVPEAMPLEAGHLEQAAPEAVPEAMQLEPGAATEVEQLEPEVAMEVEQLEPEVAMEAVQLEPEVAMEAVQLEPEAATEVEQLEPGAATEVEQLEPGAATEVVQLEPEAAMEAVQLEPEVATELVQLEPEVVTEAEQLEPEVAMEAVQLEPEAAMEVISEPSQLETPEPVHLQSETCASEISFAPEALPGTSEAERVSQAVDRVFNRFKRLLVAAIVRELARPD